MKIINIIFLSILILSQLFINQQEKKKNTMTQFKLPQEPEYWKNKLTQEQYYILREKGTERPFTGNFLYNKDKGIYVCAGCGNELFSSDSKFDSHCGWPSFDREIQQGKIIYQKDYSHGMIRTEILCANCGGHLGHVFDDGPTETGKRYCLNSIALNFIQETKKENETIVLGGGCFWCLEAAFQIVDGVKEVVSGYAGGFIENPTYEQVCTGTTGHAEVVKISFDPNKITLKEILDIFFSIHDPTTLNRQGNDIGTQYRSIVFYNDENQKSFIEKYIQDLQTKKVFDRKIVTQIVKFEKFYPAEDYHQNYFKKNPNAPYCQFVVKPKVEKVQKLKK